MINSPIIQHRFLLTFGYEDQDLIIAELKGINEFLSNDVVKFSFDSVLRTFEIIFHIPMNSKDEFMFLVDNIDSFQLGIYDVDLTSPKYLTDFIIDRIMNKSMSFDYGKTGPVEYKVIGTFK